MFPPPNTARSSLYVMNRCKRSFHPIRQLVTLIVWMLAPWYTWFNTSPTVTQLIQPLCKHESGPSGYATPCIHPTSRIQQYAINLCASLNTTSTRCTFRVLCYSFRCRGYTAVAYFCSLECHERTFTINIDFILNQTV